MVQRRTNKGVIIDMEALLAQNSDEPAMGPLSNPVPISIKRIPAIIHHGLIALNTTPANTIQPAKPIVDNPVLFSVLGNFILRLV